MRNNKRVYPGKDIQNNFRLDWKIDISYKCAWPRKNVALEMLNGFQENSFGQLPLYCHYLKLENDDTVTHIQINDDWTFDKCFISFGVSIDGSHLKGTYLGTNLLVVGMDANNQIIPLATGVAQGETVENWSWFLTKLKECIGDVPNLVIESDKHYSITRVKTRNVIDKLRDAGFDRWSRAYCPGNRYNYMTSNSVESINSLTKHVRKVPITMLMEYYRDFIQRWYFERRFNSEDEPLVDELSRWATTKVSKRNRKSANWIANGIEHLKMYNVKDHTTVHVVNIAKGVTTYFLFSLSFPVQCSCRKWQLSGLPCGHICVVSRFLKMSNSNRWAKAWFSRRTLKATYQKLVYPLLDVSLRVIPNDLQVMLPPALVKPQPGRPKNKARIRSQGEEPKV
ncbi:transposase, MuDR, MULE transposase domain protein [Tanacetum coccineum]